MTGLHVHGTLPNRIEAVVHEPISVSRSDRVTVRELLRAQWRQVAGGDRPGSFKGVRDRERPIRTARSLVLHWRQLSFLRTSETELYVRFVLKEKAFARSTDHGRSVVKSVKVFSVVTANVAAEKSSPPNGWPAGSHSWRLTRRQCTIDHKPATNAVDSVKTIHRERSNIDQLTAWRPSVCCFSVTYRVPSFICNITSGTQTS